MNIDKNEPVSINQFISSEKKPDYIPLTNDLLFHMVFTKNRNALTSLLSCLLNIPEQDILKIDILNPMQYNEDFDMNLTVLDLKLHLNEQKFILVEMQVRKFLNWTERTLVYACRQIADQDKGNSFEYGLLQPVIQIAIMDHTLFPDHKRFFAKYMLKDEEAYQYTDKLQFLVLDLTAMTSANEQEKEQGLVEWANAFKAQDWAAVSKIENNGVKEALKTMEMILSNPTERQLLEDRHRAEVDRRSILSAERAQARNEGIAQGMAQGMMKGQILQSIRMYRRLANYNNLQIRDAIINEFHLSEAEAEKYLSEAPLS